MSIPPVTKTRVFKNTGYKINTIQLQEDTIRRLKYFHNRQYDAYDTYDEIITTLIDFYEKYGPKMR